MSVLFGNRETETLSGFLDSAPLTTEAVNPGSNGALVCEVARDPAFVFGAGSSNESGVEYKAVLGGVPPGLEGSGCEEGEKREREGRGEEARITC